MHTPDEPEPPRRYYDLKPKEGFERANATTKESTEAPTDVKEMFKWAEAKTSLTPKRRTTDRNEVHDILDFNVLKEKEAGLFTVKPGIDTKAVERRRKYGIPLLIVNGFAVLIVSMGITTGEWGAPEFFMLAACGSCDAVLLFHAFVLRTR